MAQLLEVALSFPSVLLTVQLGVVLLYWVFVILGALELDLFGGADIPHGAADGVVEGAMEGAAEGAAEAAGADGIFEAGILAALGLRQVPVTVAMSFLTLFAWLICLLASYWLGPWLGTLPGWVSAILLLVGSLVLAMPLTSLVSRPLAPLFAVAEAKRRADYIGSMCTITTGRVDAGFGQARIDDSGNVLIIQVRCDRDHSFSRHGQALIIDYDEARQAYLIEPMDSVLGKGQTR